MPHHYDLLPSNSIPDDAAVLAARVPAAGGRVRGDAGRDAGGLPAGEPGTAADRRARRGRQQHALPGVALRVRGRRPRRPGVGPQC